MLRYIQRYEAGKLKYLVYKNNSLIFTILENTAFSGGYTVLKYNKSDGIHFSQLEAAKNFCETSILIG